jgi:hypothetical protein
VRSAIQIVLASACSPVATAWVLKRRRTYRGIGRSLSVEELATLGPYFDRALLERVRVAEIKHIENPGPVRWAMPLGLKPSMDLRRMMGMAFVDTVVLTGWTGRVRSRSVLFHELVHVVQYQVLGTRGFLAQYVRGWLASGRDYWSIPFEEEAYSLTDRFNRGEVFAVEKEVRSRLYDR